MSAGLLLRRELVSSEQRLVDVMARRDVMDLVDERLKPVREKTRAEDENVMLKEIIKNLRAAEGALVNGYLVAAVALMSVVLLVMAGFR
jgi:hypothetical protein